MSPSTLAATYESSRQIFIEACTQCGFTMEAVTIMGNLTMDTAYCDRGSKDLLILTTGLHGVEGYVGAHMVQVYLERLHKHTTCNVLLVHGINPYGMKHFMRVNENNVDLNRNFVVAPALHTDIENPSYSKISYFLNPSSLAPWAFGLRFFYQLLGVIVKYSPKSLKESILKGQYKEASGLYYGGSGQEKSTSAIGQCLGEYFSGDYDRIISVDLHTGFGSKNRMCVVNSPKEARPAEEFERTIAYEPVIAANGDDFYAIEGDFTDFQYDLVAKLGKLDGFYGTCFEFGTLGEGLLCEIQSLYTMVFENAFRGKGYEVLRTKKMRALYAPPRTQWLTKAESDFVEALGGLIKLF